MSQYLPIFQIEVRHEFYEPALFFEHRLVPTPATEAFLLRRRLRWISEGAAHTLYADRALLGSSNASRPWLSSVPDALCFGFESSWPGFGWVTALPGAGLNTIPVYTAALTRTAKDPIEAQGPVMGVFGRRTVQYDGKEFPVLMESSPAFPKPLFFFVISGLVKKTQRTRRGPAPAETVRLCLASRATTWRYHLFNCGCGNQGYRIEPVNGRNGADGSNWPHFEPVAGIAGLGGELSLSFESDRPIPLQRRPRERFRLVGKEGILMQPLPLPGPALSRGSVKEVYCSEMVVNL